MFQAENKDVVNSLSKMDILVTVNRLVDVLFVAGLVFLSLS